MGDDQIVISSGQVITPETVTSQSFTAAFRGYHPAEVRQFLKRVSDELAAGAEREVELRRALQEALNRAAHPELDEATVTSILGEHAAKLISSARDTSTSIVEEAQQQADSARRNADQVIARMRDESEGLMARRVAEADTVAASILQAAEADAQGQIEAATQQGKDMVAEARAVRERMLGDLSRRRRAAQVQVEQLRAVRERLVAAYDVVRRTVDEATAELDAAEPEARLAAEAVARRAEEVDAGLLPESPPPATSEPPARSRRDVPAPATSGALFRRAEAMPPPAPERPRLRPQTVAAAVAGRASVPAAAPPFEPLPLPTATPVSAPSAEELSAGLSEPEPEPAPGPVPAPDLEVAASPAPAPDLEVAASPAPAPPTVADLAELSDLGTSEVPAINGDAPPGNVDELFARLRADRQPPRVDGSGNDLLDPFPPPAASPPPHVVDPVAGESALEGRDDLLDSLEAGLTRALKRVLGDEQNEVLDGLRRLGTAAGDDVLPDADAQRAGYRDAAVPWLQQAARAGVGFVSDPESGSGAETAHPAVDGLALALAHELVEPLRDRLSRALAGAADADDPSVVAESMRATYRQWKVQQVEECARHHVVAAFSAGAFAATPDLATLQWLVDDDGHCPDCDDNALAGPTAKGEPFPTGQLHPPAHPGCRCLLVPITA